MTDSSEEPASRLAIAIIDMAERDKGLTRAGLMDLINEHTPSKALAHREYELGYQLGQTKGYAKALEDLKNDDIQATRKITHSIALSILAKYGITNVATEIFDHGRWIGICAEHNGKKDAVRVGQLYNGNKIPLQVIENAAFKLAKKLTQE